MVDPARTQSDAADATRRLEQLRRLLQAEGFLAAGPDQPITGKDGTRSPWMLYTPQVTLSHGGIRLAASCLLDRLASFRSTQLAAHGYTALPLVAGCVALGGGRYTGLMVREARKTHGANRQVEGAIDRSRPVVVVDDSLSSGTSFRGAARALESIGLEVEGTLALVHFSYGGGADWARALGYRVDTLLDVWDDLERPRPTYTAPHELLTPSWAEEVVPEGLHPAEVARLVAEHQLRSGTVPMPPARFDGDYDAPGGVFVSFRDVRTDERIARGGVWHFDPEDADPPRDVVLATARALKTAAGRLTPERLPSLKIAVSLLSRLEPAGPSELDFDRYGVVVRSRYWPAKVGGALPNTQVYTSEIEQLTHARRVNARIGELEPYEIFVHEVSKQVEPGHSWLPYGVGEEPGGWRTAPGLGERLTGRAREALDALLGGRTPPAEGAVEELAGASLAAVGVTLYDQGATGCGVAWSAAGLDEALLGAARYAVADRRFGADPAAGAQRGGCLVVSLLHDREWLGDVTVQDVGWKMRPGLDAISVHQGDRQAVFLESVVPHNNWSTEHAAGQLLEKAGVADGPKAWCTYRTTSWLSDGRGVSRLDYGAPRREPAPAIDREWVNRTLSSTAGYLYRSLDSTGLPAYRTFPVSGLEVRVGASARLCHGLGALAAAARALENPVWLDAAVRGLAGALRHVTDEPAGARLQLPGHQNGRLGDLVLLEAVALSGDPGLRGAPLQRLGTGLRALFHPDGRIADDRETRIRQLQDHDFLPGFALLAFADAAAATGNNVFRVDWERPLAWYTRRFEHVHPWGLIAWHLQAWTAVYRLTGRHDLAEVVFRMADWVVERQLRKNGAFLTTLYERGPSFHTAFVAEGLADASWLAVQLGDSPRARRYAESWRAAMAFMERLVIVPEDTYCMPRPEAAIGGVRATESTFECRVDYVGHMVMALVKGLAAGAVDGRWPSSQGQPAA